MSYEDAFGAVPGCEVIWCEYFGIWRGELLAKIKYKGEILYIRDYFGSCSASDSFQQEFLYDGEEDQKKLAAFGLPYVESALPLQQIIEVLRKENSADCWGEEIVEMLDKLENEII